MLHNSNPLINVDTEATLDTQLALDMVRAIKRNPKLLEGNADLLRMIASIPPAREALNRVFATSKKVAFRYQTARVQFAVHAAAA
jgi:hypothetical protein